MEFVNGAIYIGEFKGGIPHGKGKYTYKDQSQKGNWSGGKLLIFNNNNGRWLWYTNEDYHYRWFWCGKD